MIFQFQPSPIKLLKVKIKDSQCGQRLDQALAKLLPDYSRSIIKKWILENKVYVNGVIINRPTIKVLGSEKININLLIIDDIQQQHLQPKPQNIPLNIIYEDNDIIVINKSSGLVVHPGAGNLDNTILNALLYRYPQIINVPRAGIIHRLDKDTTGLMVIAKNIYAHTNLVKMWQLKKVIREYEAIVNGNTLMSIGTVDAPITRHPRKRTQMAIHPFGKRAITHYKVIERFSDHALLRLRLESGRTHQIRVHMAYINHPVFGDRTYGGVYSYDGSFKKRSESEEFHFSKVIKKFNRPALHSALIRIHHPITGMEMEWELDIPADMLLLVNILKAINNTKIKDKDT